MKYLLFFCLIITGEVVIAQNVGIGTQAPAYKLHVETSGTAIYGYSTGGSYGIYGRSSFIGVFGSGSTYGVYGSGNTYGVYGSGNTYGIYGSGSSAGVYGSAYTLDKSGVHGEGTYAFGISGNSSNNYGGFFTSTNLHGIYAGTSSTAGNVYAAVFKGNTYSYGSYLTSDERVKKDISDFKSGMAIINQLKPKSYDFRTDGDYAKLHLPKGNHFGFLAQDIEKLFPGLVGEAPLEVESPIENIGGESANNVLTDTSALEKQSVEHIQTIAVKAINYTELIPVIIEGMQELDAENQTLKKQLSDLQQEIVQLKELIQKPLSK